MAEKFSHTNSKGVTYYLNVKAVTLRGGEKKDIYFFTKYKNSNTGVEELPEDMEVRENPRNGFLTVVRKGTDLPTTEIENDDDFEEED